MKNDRIVTAAITVVALILTACGCATPNHGGAAVSSGTERPLAVASSLRFDDIPVPFGFASIPAESFIYQTENIRAGLMKYKGRSSPEVMMQFYKEQMPVYNWQPVNIIEFGKKQLSFEKPGQSCVVVIEGSGSGESIITISIGPKSEKSKILK
jgi:hypothetical protein